MASHSQQAARGPLRVRSHPPLVCLALTALVLLGWSPPGSSREAGAGAAPCSRLLLEAAARDGASIAQVLGFASPLLREVSPRQPGQGSTRTRLPEAGLREALADLVAAPPQFPPGTDEPARHPVGPLQLTRAEARALVAEPGGRDRWEIASRLRGLLAADHSHLTSEDLAALVPRLVALAEGPWSPEPELVARIRVGLGLPASGVAE